MTNFKNKPAITQKYHIEVPLHEVYSGYCIYCVYFGEKYYIGKGKSLMQSIQNMATIIERGIRLRNSDEADIYYHVITHIVKNSVINGTASVMAGEGMSEFELLQYEQQKLDQYRNDKNILNNNFDAYIPKWIPEIEAQKFLQWKGVSKKAIVKRAEKIKRQNLFVINYLNENDKNKRGVYKIFFGDKFYIGRAKLLYSRISTHLREIKKRISGVVQLSDNDFYKKIVEAINDSNIKVATCVLLQECKSVAELILEEQKFLDKYKKNKNCLNISFVARGIATEKDDTVEDSLKKPIVFVRDGKKVFFSRKHVIK